LAAIIAEIIHASNVNGVLKRFFRRATKLARDMVTRYGGNVAF
jgi:ATP-dependent Zn protease